MPSKSPSQKRLMAAAAHTPGGFDGVSQAVGREFNDADQAERPAKFPMRGSQKWGKSKSKTSSRFGA